MMRNFGSSLFISMAVLVLVRSTAVNYARMTEFITPYRKELTFPGMPEAWNVETTTGLLRVSNEIQRQAAMIGYVNAFYLMAFTALVALPLACLLRRPVHRHVGWVSAGTVGCVDAPAAARRVTQHAAHCVARWVTRRNDAGAPTHRSCRR